MDEPDNATHSKISRVGSAVILDVFDGPFMVARIKMSLTEAREFAGWINDAAKPARRAK